VSQDQFDRSLETQRYGIDQNVAVNAANVAANREASQWQGWGRVAGAVISNPGFLESAWDFGSDVIDTIGGWF